MISLGLIVILSCAAAGFAAAASGSGDSPLFTLNTRFLSPVEQDQALPAIHSLGACSPNPFNPSTTISYSLAGPATVNLAIYDLTGRLVRHLINEEPIPGGEHQAMWTGRDERDRLVAAGVYLYRLKAGNFNATRRMTLIK